MDITADARLSFPRPLVFACYRDKMADLLPYLANVRKIEVKARVEEGPVVKLTNIWHGGGEIPAAARAVLSEAMLTWTDNATWNESDFTCAWVITTHAFTEAVECSGVNRFVEDGGGTRIEMRGAIKIDAKKIKGVPGFLAGGVGRTVEEFLKSKVQPNFVEVTQAIASHLAKTGG